MAPRKPRGAAAAVAATAAHVDDLDPLPPPNGVQQDDDGDGNDDDDNDDGDDDGDGDGAQAGPRNGFVEIPQARPLVEVTPESRPGVGVGRGRASGGPPPSPNPRGIRGPRSMSDADRAHSPALKSVQRYQEAAYAEIDSLLATLNFAERHYEVRVARHEPEVDENGVKCTGLLHTYKQRVTIDQIQQRFGGGIYEIKVWGPHPSSGRPSIIKQETFEIAGNPKPMESHVRKESESRTSDLADALRTIADSNERSQERVLSVLEKQNAKPAVGVNEIVQGLSTALSPLLEKVLTKSESDKQAELEARRAERDEQRRREDQRREDEKAERDRLREEAKERREEERQRREDERRAEDKKREEERERREDERRAEDKKREEDRRAEEKKREEDRERAKEEREKERERAKEEAAERQRIHEREMAAMNERNKVEADRQKEFLTMMQNMQNHQLEMLAKRSENGGLESMANNLRLLKELKDDVNDVGGEATGMEKFNEGVKSFVDTVAPLAKTIRGAISKDEKQPRQNQQQQQQPQAQQQAQQPQAQQGGQPQIIAVDIGPARRALPNPSGGMVVPQAQQQARPPQAAPQAQPQAQPVPQAVPQEQAQPQPGDEVNDLTDFAWPSADEGMLDVGTKLLKNVDLAVQRNMSAEEIVDKILNPFDDVAPTLMSMASGMSPDELTQFIADNVPASWAILSPRGEELVLKAFEIWDAQQDDQGSEN